MDLLNKAPLVYEPLRTNRFIVRFPSDLGIQEWNVVSFARPNITINNEPINFMNTETYTIGSYKWNALTLKLRDPIGPSSSQAVMEWVRLHAESATGRMGYAAGYKRDIELEMLDPTGVCVQKWILKNAWISNCDFGSLQYSDDALADITATIVIDYAILAY
jgi:hypothetical protein